MAIPFAEIARARSFDAELATEAVGDEPDHLTNAHAARMHADAATWHTSSDHPRRAALHEAYAHVHAQLATRLRPEEDY